MDHLPQNETHDTATLELGYQQLQAATPADELAARDTDSAIDWQALKFQTTAELEPLNEIIGQHRAIAALEVGLGVPERGYNIYAARLTGTSKIETIKDTLQRRLASRISGTRKTSSAASMRRSWKNTRTG
jgi:hypothetical protein